MTYFYIALGILGLVILLLLIWLFTFRKRARLLVEIRSDEEKIRDLNHVVEPFGFQYDRNQDIFFSKKDAWQRAMGYGRVYDINAIRTNMVIDCEPIYFVCHNRSYMLEIWKGQYGLSTGAEIGLYVTDERNDEHPEKLFYQCISDEEMINMRFVLRKKERILMIRDEVHWWLTGFVLGVFSQPNELSMDVAIGFADQQMRNAFCNALVEAGYEKDSIYVSGLRVSFSFTKPHTKQPAHIRFRVGFTQWMNRKNCKKYQRVTRHFTRTIDKVDYIGMCFPGLYKLLGGFSRIPQKQRHRRKRTISGNRV